MNKSTLTFVKIYLEKNNFDFPVLDGKTIKEVYPVVQESIYKEQVVSLIFISCLILGIYLLSKHLSKINKEIEKIENSFNKLNEKILQEKNKLILIDSFGKVGLLICLTFIIFLLTSNILLGYLMNPAKVIAEQYIRIFL